MFDLSCKECPVLAPGSQTISGQNQRWSRYSGSDTFLLNIHSFILLFFFPYCYPFFLFSLLLSFFSFFFTVILLFFFPYCYTLIFFFPYCYPFILFSLLLSILNVHPFICTFILSSLLSSFHLCFHPFICSFNLSLILSTIHLYFYPFIFTFMLVFVVSSIHLHFHPLIFNCILPITHCFFSFTLSWTLSSFRIYSTHPFILFFYCHLSFKLEFILLLILLFILLFILLPCLLSLYFFFHLYFHLNH